MDKRKEFENRINELEAELKNIRGEIRKEKTKLGIIGLTGGDTSNIVFAIGELTERETICNATLEAAKERLKTLPDNSEKIKAAEKQADEIKKQLPGKVQELLKDVDAVLQKAETVTGDFASMNELIASYGLELGVFDLQRSSKITTGIYSTLLQLVRNLQAYDSKLTKKARMKERRLGYNS